MLNKLKVTAKNSVIYSIGNFATKFAGLFLLPLYTSKFSVDEYGVIGLLEVTVQIMIALFGLNLFNAFFRWYWDKEFIKKQKSIYFTVLTSVSVVTVFFVSFLVIFGNIGSQLIFSDKAYSLIFRLSVISAGLETIGVIPSTLLRLQGRATKYTIAYVLKLITNVGLNIYLIVYRNLGIESIYYSSITGNLIYLAFLSKESYLNSTPIFEKKILKSMLSFSIPLLLSTITGVILTVTDRYVLRFMSGLNDVGTYSLAYKLANSIRFLIIIPVNLAVLPIFYKIIDEPGSKRFYARFTTYYTFVVIMAVLVTTLYSDVIVKVFARNKEYWDSIKVIPILAGAVLFGMLKDMALTGLQIKRKTKPIAITIISLAILNLGLNMLLIPAYKSLGASFSTLATQALFFITAYILSQKVYPIPYELSRIIKMIFAASLIYVANLFFIDVSFILKSFINLILLCSYPLILYTLKFFEPQEFKSIAGFIKKWKNLGNLKANITDLIKQPLDD